MLKKFFKLPWIGGEAITWLTILEVGRRCGDIVNLEKKFHGQYNFGWGEEAPTMGRFQPKV